MSVQLHCGDCLSILPTLAAGSVDSVVTDPPAGIGFMGKEWDSFGGKCNANAEKDRDAANRGPGAGLGNQPFGYSGSSMPKRGEREAFIAFLSERLAAARRVLKPGHYALVWAIPRTSHWTATAIEDAGFEVRDIIMHLFGQGFPKGKGCLKPACEHWILARKPGAKVLPLGIDGCRIGADTIKVNGWKCGGEQVYNGRQTEGFDGGTHSGRWPANLLLTHHPDCNGSCVDSCPVRLLDEQSGEASAKAERVGRRGGKGFGLFDDAKSAAATGRWPADPGGGASRFFPRFRYEPKASRRDRNEGLEGMPETTAQSVALGERKYGTLPYTGEHREMKPIPRANHHPTVKPTDLMRWLCRLITPPSGTVLDPFAGSGSTGKAAVLEGFGFVGIELNEEYLNIARRRINAALASQPLFAQAQ